MIDYRKLGFISNKQHTQCEFENQMLIEHVITREGFHDLYSILYQKRAPTHEIKAEIYKHNNPYFPSSVKKENRSLQRKHFQTNLYSASGTMLESRATLMCNSSCTIGLVKQNKTDESFFSNGDSDELFYVSEGKGILQTIMGELDYTEGDYLFIPKGISYRFIIEIPHHMLVIEGKHHFGIPPEFKNSQGQIKLDAPYNHRDFRPPSRLLDLKNQKNYSFIVKKENELTLHEYTDFPYQVVGWDGWYWPFAFSIYAYQPKTSSVHLPPSIHSAFSGDKFYIMNFVPRMLDYHPKAIPCPWPHSSVDCDEVIFYARGNFTSRRNIAQHSISYHPCGIPHGPHPEKYEQSLGVTKTEELGIMIDTLEPLYATDAALLIEDKDYHYTWNSKDYL